MITFSRRKVAHDAALSRKSYPFAGADDIATADSFPPHDLLPDVARRFLADGYPELSRHLTRTRE
jgi:hypothetical protein